MSSRHSENSSNLAQLQQAEILQPYKVQIIFASTFDFACFFIRLYEEVTDMLFAAAEKFRMGHTIFGIALEKFFRGGAHPHREIEKSEIFILMFLMS